MNVVIHTKPVDSVVYRVLAEVEQRPLFGALTRCLGLEFFELRSYLFQGAQMSEPYGHNRTAVYKVTKQYQIEALDHPRHYETVPLGEYIFAGQCGWDMGYLVTKRNAKDQVLGSGHDTYPHMGYACFSLRMRDDELVVWGPMLRDPVPEGWPPAD